MGTKAIKQMRRLACAVALVLPLATAAGAEAPVSSLRQLARRADLIAFGHCQSAQSSWDEQHRLIVTTFRFQPRRTFKGVAVDSVTVKALGGQVGDQAMTASHSTAMRTGEEAVLFLQRSRFGDYFVIAGGTDGKLPVVRNAKSERPLIRGALSLDDFGNLLADPAEAQ
jgi:hypothetical protein